MYNQITLIGNLTRDIELRYSQSGMGIANTAIATSHKYTSNGEKKEDVCFVDITAFGKVSEIMNQYLRKGSKVLIVGRLNLDQWQDQQGQKRSKHSVIVETLKMLDSKGDNQEQPQSQAQQSYAQPQQKHTDYQPQQMQQRQQPQGQQQLPQQPPVIDIDKDEIPF